MTKHGNIKYIVLNKTKTNRKDKKQLKHIKQLKSLQIKPSKFFFTP